MLAILLELAHLVWIISSRRSDSTTVFLLIYIVGKLLQSSLGVERHFIIHHPQYKVAKLHTELEVSKLAERSHLPFIHAESPVYDPDSHTLYWVDVLNQNILALDYTTFEYRIKHIAYGEVNLVIPVANSSRLLVGCRSQLFLMDWQLPGDSALKLVATLDALKPDHVLNEGKADVLGRFWGGTKGPQYGDEVKPDQGSVYSLQRPNYVPTIQLKPVTISNGLTWALNNTILFYIDSVTDKIEAFDYDVKKGEISGRRTIIDFTKHGYPSLCPDGMTIDRDGYLWVVLHFNASVIRVDPDRGRIVEEYVLPVYRTTSLTWAGNSLEDLVVTTSRRNMRSSRAASSPLSGTVLVLRKLGTGGVPDHKFIFDDADNY